MHMHLYVHMHVYTYIYMYIDIRPTLNSSPPRSSYMRLWIRSALVQIMVCSLFGAKPLSKPMLGYEANMGPTWVLSAPDGPHVGPMNLAIRGVMGGNFGVGSILNNVNPNKVQPRPGNMVISSKPDSLTLRWVGHRPHLFAWCVPWPAWKG